MKKIMFIDEHHLINYPGGVEKVLASFSNEFVDRGYEVIIVGMDTAKGALLYPLDKRVKFVNLCYIPDEPVFGGFSYFLKKVQKELLRTIAGSQLKIGRHKFQDPKKEYFFTEFIRRLRGCIEEHQPNVILAITPDSAYLAQQSMGAVDIPVIGMCHSETTDIPGRLTERQLTAWRKCRVVQVLLPAFIADIKQCGIENVISISNVVEQIPDRQVRKLDDCYHKIVMIGRLDGGNKRQHLLVEAFSLIAERYPKWNVYIYGSPDNKRYERKLKQSIVKYHLQNRVFLSGVTTDVSAVLNHTDIFAFPSEHEGFSMSMTEAMGMGLPVVACRDCMSVGAIIEDGKTGLLTDPSPDSLSAALMVLMDNLDIRKRLGRAAHADMCRYAPKVVFDKWEKIICLENKN